MSKSDVKSYAVHSLLAGLTPMPRLGWDNWGLGSVLRGHLPLASKLGGGRHPSEREDACKDCLFRPVLLAAKNLQAKSEMKALGNRVYLLSYRVTFLRRREE